MFRRQKSVSSIAISQAPKFEQDEASKLGPLRLIKIYWWVITLVFREEKLMSAVYYVASIIQPLLGLVNLYLFARIIDVAVSLVATKGTIYGLLPYLLLVLGLTVTQFIVDTIDTMAGIALRQRTPYKINRLYYKKLVALGIQTLESPHLNNRVNRAEPYIKNLIAHFMNVTSVLVALTSSISAAVLVAKSIPVIIPIILVFFIPYVFLDKRFRRKMFKFDFENTEKIRRATASASSLSDPKALQEILTSRSVGFLDAMYAEVNSWYYRRMTPLMRRRRISNESTDLFLDVSILVASIRIFTQFFAGVYTIGYVTFLIRTISSFKESIKNAVTRLNEMSEVALRLNDAYIVFNSQSLFEDGEIRLPKLITGPELELKNVSYKYPTGKKPIFSNLALTIKSGEKVAVVGHNGAGKTTLVKLLCRIYRPQRGEIFINGLDLNSLSIEDWYDNIGILFQDYNFYPQLTVAENIYVGDSMNEYDETRAIKALKSADAYKFVMEYPNKLNQLLSEKYKEGIRPSTGQWQKLALARFFYRNAPFVVFDEPTAAIDAISEYNIFNKIYSFFQDKTVFIVSHRFSTVRNADRILVMDHGKIIEQGNHSHLMTLDGYYASAFKLQAEGYKDSGDSIDET